MEGTLFSPMKNSTTFDDPLDSEKERHFEGFNFMPIDSIFMLISFINFWWVLLLVVMRQKSSA